MNRRRLAIVAALAVWMHSCATYAQSKIDVPAKVELGEPIVASVQLPAGGKVAWKAGAGVSLIDAGEGRAYLWAKPGQAKIEAVLVSVTDGQLGTLEWLEATFEVEGAVPPTPVPPTPVPPTPNPPGPVPIVETGLRVLIVYDADSKASLPREQMALLDSPTFRAWLDAHCVRSTDGTSEWRIAPHETEFNADQPVWQKAMALPRQGLPWLVVSNGTAGESVPLPANEAAAIALIGRYAP